MYYAWPGSVRSACADRASSTLTKARVHAKYRVFPPAFPLLLYAAQWHTRAPSPRVYMMRVPACIRAYMCARARTRTHICVREAARLSKIVYVCLTGERLPPSPPLVLPFIIILSLSFPTSDAWTLSNHGRVEVQCYRPTELHDSLRRNASVGSMPHAEVYWVDGFQIVYVGAEEFYSRCHLSLFNRIDDQSLIRAISRRTRENARIVKADAQVYSFLTTTWLYLANREFTGECHACDWAMDTKIDFQLRAATAARFLRSSRFLRTTNLCYATDHCVCGTLFFYVITLFTTIEFLRRVFACRLLSAAYLASWRVSLILISQSLHRNCSIAICTKINLYGLMQPHICNAII